MIDHNGSPGEAVQWLLVDTVCFSSVFFGVGLALTMVINTGIMWNKVESVLNNSGV